ncbi:MAG: hypothetical protein AAF757_18655 [Cyanobacteria bacterium P01_D01_bin.116]
MTSQIAIVVDYEAFKGDVVKELAIATPYYQACVLLKPPTNFQNLTIVEQKVNSWLSRHMHKIDWNAGTYDYSHLKCIVEGFISPNATFYAKGEEKTKLLSNMFGKCFINLEGFDCPRIEKVLEAKQQNTTCSVCPSIHGTNFHNCALNKAAGLHEWLTNNYSNIVYDINN